MHYVGIDLGTTNCVASIGNIMADGFFKPEVIYIPQIGENKQLDFGEKLLPSVLYAEGPKHHYVGKYARNMMGQAGDRVVAWVKRQIGKKDAQPYKIDGQDYSPEYVSSFYLCVLKKALERELHVQDLLGATITVPASFNFQQIAATRVAAQLAGFQDEKISFISEPTAAVLDFINKENNRSAASRLVDFSEPKLLLVFDLGGGTCDVSILQVQINSSDGSVDIVEMKPSRYSELGGIDFDQALVMAMLNDFLAKNKLDWAGVERDQRQWITYTFMTCAEKAKLYFSTEIFRMKNSPNNNYNEEDIDAIVFDYYVDLGEVFPGKSYFLHITKADYDQIIGPLLHENQTGQKNMIDPVVSALRKNNLAKEQIDHVLLVGGMTEFRTVQKVLENYFDPGNCNKKILYGALEPMFSVANGAAVYNYFRDKISIKRGESDTSGTLPIGKDSQDPFKINNVDVVVPETIFIEGEDGDFVLLPAGIKAPFERVIRDKFYVVDQLGMGICLWQGENEYDMNPVKLNEGQVIFKTPQKRGTAVNLRVTFDTNREITVKAWLANDQTEVIDVRVGNATMSKDEIQAMSRRRGQINVPYKPEEAKV